MNQPISGGQYVRDPETGAITKVTDTPAVASAALTETTPPVEKTAPAKGRRNV